MEEVFALRNLRQASFMATDSSGDFYQMKQLIVATGNAHKVEEFDGLLKASGFEVFSNAVALPMLEDGDNWSQRAD